MLPVGSAVQWRHSISTAVKVRQGYGIQQHGDGSALDASRCWTPSATGSGLVCVLDQGWQPAPPIGKSGTARLACRSEASGFKWPEARVHAIRTRRSCPVEALWTYSGGHGHRGRPSCAPRAARSCRSPATSCTVRPARLQFTAPVRSLAKLARFSASWHPCQSDAIKMGFMPSEMRSATP